MYQEQNNSLSMGLLLCCWLMLLWTPSTHVHCTNNSGNLYCWWTCKHYCTCCIDYHSWYHSV